MAQANKVGLAELLDEQFPSYGNWQGMSLGWTTTIWLAHLLSEGDHRLNQAQSWVEQRLATLAASSGPAVRPLAWSDDRLAIVLDELSQTAKWQALERELNRRPVRVYRLTPRRVRLDSTTTRGHWMATEDGLFPFGHSKDHRPDRPQRKGMLATLDPLGLPVATQVVAGNRADDPLYLPAIEQVRPSLGETGLLYVGDCKMGAIQTRATLAAQGDDYLCPLADKQLPGEVLDGYLQPVWDEQQGLTPIYRENEAGERARVVNRLQKVLEQANIKLASVATDVLGVSGRQMLEALVAGRSDAQTMAELAKGRLRNKMAELEKALTGVVRAHHRFLLAQHLAHIDFLDEQVDEVGRQIAVQVEAMSQPPDAPGDAALPSSQVGAVQADPSPLSWSESVTLLDTAPGVDQRAAEMVLAETGVNMAQFASERHLTAWAGLAPGNNQSGGKRKNAKTREGNRNLRQVMIQIAWAASRKKDSYTQALYRRLAARRGKKRAIVAVARSLLESFYFMLLRGQPSQDLGGDYFEKQRKTVRVDTLTK